MKNAEQAEVTDTLGAIHKQHIFYYKKRGHILVLVSL